MNIIAPNITCHPYRVTLATARPYAKITAAEFVVNATSAEAARDYTENWVILGVILGAGMTVTSVVPA